MIAVDPGTRALGWAEFFNGKLQACGVLRANSATHMIAKLRVDHDFDVVPLVVVEVPEHRGRGAKGSPQDLIELALVAGAALALGNVAHRVAPSEWKRSLPKDICHRRIRALLDDEEREIFDAAERHDARDAIGIGMFHLGRFRP